MSANEWYFMGFILTLLAAVAFWGMAGIIYRKDRKNPLNVMLAVCFLFAGMWVPFGFVEKISSQPNDTLALWSYRLAYTFGNPALFFLFLFTLILYLGRKPSNKLLYPLYVLASLVSLLALSPLCIEQVTYGGATLTVVPGPLYGCLNIFYVLTALGTVFFLLKKWYASTGIDRARTNTMLLGVGAVLPIAIVCNIVIPFFSGNAISTNLTFIAGAIIPPVALFYSIVKLRLLDIRLILRRSGVALIAAIAFSLPLVTIFALSYLLDIDRAAELIMAALLLPLMVWLYPVLWKKIERLSAKIFFSNMYDTSQVLEEVATLLAEPANRVDNVFAVLATILEAVGLIRSELWLLPGILNEAGMCFGCFRGEGDTVRQALVQEVHFPDWLTGVERTMVTEELERWPNMQDERKLGLALRQCGYSACFPAGTLRKTFGYILVGEKCNQGALSSTDLDLIEKTSAQVTLYLDNYTLSTELDLRLEELNKADRFKREIILLTAHEFRTPITVVNGLVELLSVNWDMIDEEKKLGCMRDLAKSSQRLCELSDEVFLLSNHYAGSLVPRIAQVDIEVLLEKLFASYPESEKNRLIIDKSTQRKTIPSDLNHLFMLLKQVANNALRFSDEKQPVVIRVADDPADAVNFAVQDFGRGLSQEDMEHVFEPFFHVEDIRHHTKGIGLGLHLVKILSAELNIRINLESELGAGTTITLSIPTGISS
ncbi:MAG: HAMP domain-containing sensor histidine kinase [Actinomycetota bacterium]